MIIKFRIIKDLDIYSLLLTISQNVCGLYFLRIKKSQTITNELSNLITLSKRTPVKLESDRGTEFYNNIFQNILKVEKLHYSRLTVKGPSITEGVIRTVSAFLKKPVCEKVMLIGSLNYSL